MEAKRGQSVVEFALILPVLILLVAGIVDLTNGFQTYVALTNAAREGAIHGASGATSSEICTRVQQSLPSTISVACGSVTVSYPAVTGDATCTGGSALKGCPIRVAISYSLPTFFGGVLGFNTMSLATSIDMMVLGTP